MALRRKNYGVVIAAVSAVMLGSFAKADTLTWDSSGAGGAAPVDGTGTWDLSLTNWSNGASNVAWPNAGTNSAVLGAGAFDAGGPDDSFVLLLGSSVVVQDLTLGTSTGGGYYNIAGTGSTANLTLNGSLIKNSNKGGSQIQLSGELSLALGNHLVALRDTGGDLAEVAINNVVSGAGGITVDNTTAGNEQYGTLLLTSANTYAGGTTVNLGRLAITDSGALGTGGVVIQNAGTLSFGGAGTDSGALNITNSITIKRSDYDTANHTYYPAAIIATNDGTKNVHTISGPLIIDSTDARIQADTNRIIISSNITQGPSVTSGVLTVGGDFAGFIELTGNNTALLGGIKLIGGVQLEVHDQNNLGGAASHLEFAGSATLHPIDGFMTNFGSHSINATTFSGGINVDKDKVFNIDQALGSPMGNNTTRVGGLGKRGFGTMNINSSVNLRGGQTFWDAGTVNVNVPIELANLHLRSPIVNIGTGGSITMDAGYSSFGQDTGASINPDTGAPMNDTAVLNLTGNGILTQTNNDDFNISDNGGTQGTINISGTAQFNARGLVHVGRNGGGALGTINQSGGSITLTRPDNFAFILGRDSGHGVYNLSGGTFSAVGEVYVGQGSGDGNGHGQWNQTGGTATISNWFVIGREGGAGDVDISGGTLIKNAGGNTPIGEGGNSRTNSFMVRGTGTFDAQTGEVWVSNGNNTVTMTVKDNGTFNVNNWLAIGRFGDAKGTLVVAGNAVINKGFTTGIDAGAQAFVVAPGGGSTGTVNQTGGTINATASETWISDGGLGVWNLSGGTVNASTFDVGHTGGSSGTLNVSGTGKLNAVTLRVGEVDSVAGTVNLSGGSIKAGTIVARNSTGAKTFNFTGGTLSVDNYNFPTNLNNSGTGVLAPGGVGTIGTTAISAGYTQSTLASLAIDIAGDTSFDKVIAGGVSVFNGSLSVDVLGSYNPVGKTFDVLTLSSGTLSGTPTLTGPDAGLFTVSIFGGNTLRLTTIAQGNNYLPGDFNFDGGIDFTDINPFIDAVLQGDPYTSFIAAHGADFTALYGGTLTPDIINFIGDFNGDTGFDFTDINPFIAVLLGGRSAVSVVPEPTSLSMLGLGAVALIRRRRRA